LTQLVPSLDYFQTAQIKADTDPTFV
jgi:hypothetical protein